jgi:hypothetical protein
MKRTIAAFLTLVVVLFGGMISLSAPARAFNVLGNVCQNGGSSSAVCQDQNNGSTNPLTGPNGIILKAAYITAAIAGLAAVIILVLAGLSYISSGGDPAKTKAARTAIISTVIGVAIILLADSIIGLVVSKL